MFEYEFGGKVYEQKKLVWGQLRQLVKLIKKIEFRSGMTTSEFITILDDKLLPALAVVLTEKGSSIKDKNAETLATELEFAIGFDDALKVIEDFFVCNPMDSYLNKISEFAGKVASETTKATGDLTETSIS
jgi:hypothetical protein